MAVVVHFPGLSEVRRKDMQTGLEQTFRGKGLTWKDIFTIRDHDHCFYAWSRGWVFSARHEHPYWDAQETNGPVGEPVSVTGKPIPKLHPNDGMGDHHDP